MAKNRESSLAISLKKRLADDRRVALLGIGSRYRGDDSAGLIVADTLAKRRFSGRAFRVFIGETAPENFTGEIRSFRPGHVLLVDAADFGKKPGCARIIEPAQTQVTCFCTHQLPLQILADYLIKSVGCRVTIIGIQAKTLDFNDPLTPAVKTGCARLVRELELALKSPPASA